MKTILMSAMILALGFTGTMAKAASTVDLTSLQLVEESAAPAMLAVNEIELSGHYGGHGGGHHYSGHSGGHYSGHHNGGHYSGHYSGHYNGHYNGHHNGGHHQHSNHYYPWFSGAGQNVNTDAMPSPQLALR